MRTLWDHQKLTANSLISWGIKNGSPWDLSLIMKFMGYYQRHNPPFVVPVEELQNLIAHASLQKDWPWYPTCHIWKWALYLALVSGDNALIEQAFSLLQPLGEDEFTLKTLEIPLLMLQCRAKAKNPKPVLQKLEELTVEQPFFKECMERFQWQSKFPPQTSKEWDLWDVVTMLPFYYG